MCIINFYLFTYLLTYLLTIHGRRSVGGQGAFSPTFEVQAVFCPLLSGVDIFVLMHSVFIGGLEQYLLNLVDSHENY